VLERLCLAQLDATCNQPTVRYPHCNLTLCNADPTPAYGIHARLDTAATRTCDVRGLGVMETSTRTDSRWIDRCVVWRSVGTGRNPNLNPASSTTRNAGPNPLSAIDGCTPKHHTHTHTHTNTHACARGQQRCSQCCRAQNKKTKNGNASPLPLQTRAAARTARGAGLSIRQSWPDMRPQSRFSAPAVPPRPSPGAHRASGRGCLDRRGVLYAVECGPPAGGF